MTNEIAYNPVREIMINNVRGHKEMTKIISRHYENVKHEKHEAIVSPEIDVPKNCYKSLNVIDVNKLNKEYLK